MEKKMNNLIESKTGKEVNYKLVPGKFAICGYCSPSQGYCSKYEISRSKIGEYTWENCCLESGGCDRWF